MYIHFCLNIMLQNNFFDISNIFRSILKPYGFKIFSCDRSAINNLQAIKSETNL